MASALDGLEDLPCGERVQDLSFWGRCFVDLPCETVSAGNATANLANVLPEILYTCALSVEDLRCSVARLAALPCLPAKPYVESIIQRNWDFGANCASGKGADDGR